MSAESSKSKSLTSASSEKCSEQYLKAISVDELHKAAYDCKKGISWKASVVKWIQGIVTNVIQLHEDLVNNEYKIQSYQVFQLYDPKPRTICATRFRDRVFQRSLCRNGLYDMITKSFIYDNLACQNGKGLTAVIKQMKYHLHRHFAESHSNSGYVVYADIHHYFNSTPHEELKKIVSNKIKDNMFKMRFYEIIDSFKDTRPEAEVNTDPFGARGIGLGSQCSQLLQLLYLDRLDHYIKEKLRIKHYVRYMDDMVLIVPTKTEAEEAFRAIKAFVEARGLQLNPKSKIADLRNGLKFVKTVYKLTKTGKIKTKAASRNINMEFRRLNALSKKLASGKIFPKCFVQHCYTWKGFAQWKASRQQISAMFYRTLECLKRAVQNNRSSLQLSSNTLRSQIQNSP